MELNGPGFLLILVYGGNIYLTIGMTKFYYVALKVYVSLRDKAEGDSCWLEGNTKPFSRAALTSFSLSYLSNILNLCLYNGTRQNQIKTCQKRKTVVEDYYKVNYEDFESTLKNQMYSYFVYHGVKLQRNINFITEPHCLSNLKQSHGSWSW